MSIMQKKPTTTTCSLASLTTKLILSWNSSYLIQKMMVKSSQRWKRMMKAELELKLLSPAGAEPAVYQWPLVTGQGDVIIPFLISLFIIFKYIF